MREIKVTFKTLTPLWTGDAWRRCDEIRSSSIIGSLRFWFEVVCYFSGITNETNYEDKGKELKDNVEYVKFKGKILESGTNFDSVDKVLAELGITLPSRIFGCTGWKGWVRIKRIEPIEDYCFGNRLNLPFGVVVKKDFSEIKELNNFRDLDKRNYSGWFFDKPYFYGKFTIVFEVEEGILESVFYPLLRFIEKYGFLGGKWNIGYGRVEIESVDDDLWNDKFTNKNDNEIEFNFDKTNFKKISELVKVENVFSSSTQSYEFLKFFLGVDSFYCSNERDFREKISNIPCDMRIAKLNDDFSDFQNAIKELLKIKATIRNCLRADSSIRDKQKWHDFRHALLGTTSGGLEGTKIIPWIYEENNELKGGFISIVGLLNLEGKENG